MIGYRLVRALVLGLAKLLWRIRIVGSERIPASGAVILAPSHRSNIDVFLAPLATTRRCRFMTKKEVWKSKILGRAAASLGAFPVERGAPDRAALRASVEYLEDGDALMVYPEGTRRSGPVIEDLHDGAAYLAARTGAPIVPIGISATEEILPKGRTLPRLHKVTIVVGDPIEPPRRDGAVKRAGVRELTEELRVALQKVFDEAHGR